jgi:hypothetical protein
MQSAIFLIRIAVWTLIILIQFPCILTLPEKVIDRIKIHSVYRNCNGGACFHRPSTLQILSANKICRSHNRRTGKWRRWNDPIIGRSGMIARSGWSTGLKENKSYYTGILRKRSFAIVRRNNPSVNRKIKKAESICCIFTSESSNDATFSNRLNIQYPDEIDHYPNIRLTR